MDNRKIIIIAIVILIAASALVMLMSMGSYERVEITPNGTSIDVPSNHLTYHGDIEGIRFWKWNYGALVSYNSEELTNALGLSGLSINVINDLIKNGNSQNIDGFSVYVLNANEVLDLLEINYNGKIYCIPLANETTHDNILIFSHDRDTAMHIAKSVEYKTG